MGWGGQARYIFGYSRLRGIYHGNYVKEPTYGNLPQSYLSYMYSNPYFLLFGPSSIYNCIASLHCRLTA